MANRDYVLSATLELKDKLTGKLNDAGKGLEGVKGSAAAASGALDGVGTSAVKAAADTGRLKSALSGVKGNYSATLSVKDMASPAIRKVNGGIRDLSIHGNNITLTVTTEDKASPALSKVKSGLQSVKGNYSATLSVKDEASGKLSAIKSSVRELAGRASAVTVRARDEASSKLTRIKEELAGLAGKTYTAMVNVKQNGGFGKLKESMSGFASGMLMNTSMQMAGAAGIGYGVYDTVKTSMNFDAALSGVKALVPAGEDATRVMEAVRQKAMELGQETAFGDTDVAKGMTELLKAGIDLKSVMGDATKAALDLAVVGGLELPEAAKVMSTAMNAFKVTDATHAADTLSGAANASATNVHEMSYAMSACASVAAGMGVSFEDTSAALALFAKNGLLGSDAGTSLKTMLSRLVPSTDQAADEFRRLGLMTADGKNKFFDAKGSMKSMAEVAGILQDALKGLTAEQRQATLNTLFGSDAIRGAIILSENGADGFNDMAEAMTRFTAAGSAAAMRDNLKGDIEELSGAWENFQVTLMSGKATSGLRGLTQELGGIVKFMTERIEDGLDFGDVFALAGKLVTDLKNKFIEFDGVGSILAGGALAAGLYKIVGLTRKAVDAVKGLAGKRKGGGPIDLPGPSSTKEMVVNAATVIVNGKSIAGGGASPGKNSGGVIFGPDGRPIQSGGRTQAPAPPPGRAAILRANAKALGGAGALAAIFGAMDIYSAKSQNSALLEEAAWGVKQASDNIEELTKNGGSQEQWRSALDEYTKANDYRAQVEHDNRMREGDAIGGALGSTVGTVLGGAIGSFAGPAGTVIGMTAGGILGEIAGKRIGSWLADYNVQNTVTFEKIAQWLNPKEKDPIGFDISGKTVPVDIVGDSIGIKDTTKDASGPFGLQTDLSAIGPHAFDTPRDTSQDFGLADMQNMYTTGMFGGVQEEAQEAASASADAFSEASASISTDFENTGAQATATADNIQMDMLGSAQGSQDAWSSFPSWYDASVAVPTSDAAAECGADVSDSFETSASDTQGAWSGVGGFFSGLFASIKSGAASCAASVAQSMASAAASARAGGHTNIAAGLDWIGNNAAWLGGVSYPHNAIGTSFAPGGWTEINEHGGEIVDLPTGSRVYPHATTLSMLKDTFENNLPTAIPVSAPSVSVDLPRTQSDAEATQVVITGNSFIVREEADMDKIAYKLLTLMQESRANMNPVEGVFA
ncbi:phage tail tape measure protein [Selenomonas bovis]|uniref:phage tail tape measure protein n=1 Tax=Selenomonas bovis TaxID=416586 RepID=UPI003AB91E73